LKFLYLEINYVDDLEFHLNLGKGRSMVEAEGIEPSSRNSRVRVSTYLVYNLNSPFFPPIDRMEKRLAAFDLPYPLLPGNKASPSF